MAYKPSRANTHRWGENQTFAILPRMFLIDQIAEQKISEAIQRGEFDHLPGSGKPLRLDDEALIPEELRAGYRLLKNAGYLPANLQLRKEIQSVETLLAKANNLEMKQQLSKQRQVLLLRLSATKPDHPLFCENYYSEKLKSDASSHE